METESCCLLNKPDWSKSHQFLHKHSGSEEGATVTIAKSFDYTKLYDGFFANLNKQSTIKIPLGFSKTHPKDFFAKKTGRDLAILNIKEVEINVSHISNNNGAIVITADVLNHPFLTYVMFKIGRESKSFRLLSFRYKGDYT